MRKRMVVPVDKKRNKTNTCDQVSHEGSNENQQSKKRRCGPYSPYVPWQTRYGELVEFRINYGHTNVPQNYAKNMKLGKWVSTQRSQYNTSTLTQERIDQLNELNFEWSLRTNQRLITIEMTKTGLERMKKQQAERERKQAEAQKLKESVRVNSICVSCQCLSLYFCYNLTFIC